MNTKLAGTTTDTSGGVVNCLYGTPKQNPDGTWTCFTGTRATAPRKPGAVYLNPSTPIYIRSCIRHQAPDGYHYIWNGLSCVLVQDRTGVQITPTTVVNNATVSTATTTTTPASSLSTWYANNKGLANLGLIGIAAYFFLGRGKAFKAREVVSTTRY